jgi:hypothetical protein
MAEAGAHVFVTDSNKRARVKWRNESTTDPAIITGWFDRWPDSLPAIDLAKSNIVVLDGDRHGGPDGVAAVDRIFAQHKLNTAAIPTVISPQDGRHFWFLQPVDGEPLGNSDRTVRDQGINVRGNGGYVIAPGAQLPDGRQYKRDSKTPSTIEALVNGTIPVLPPALQELLRPKKDCSAPSNGSAHSSAREERYADATLRRLADNLAAMPPDSGRNIELNNAALIMGHMVAAGWTSRSAVEGRLFDAAAASGLVREDGPNAVRATIKSGLDAGERKRAPPLPERSINGAAPSKANDAAATSRLPPLLSSAAFLQEFRPPDPLVEGIIMRGFIYALTAHTGRGKTAVALLIAACVALGRKLGVLEVEKGRVLILAGENPVDVQMRWIAMAQQLWWHTKRKAAARRCAAKAVGVPAPTLTYINAS